MKISVKRLGLRLVVGTPTITILLTASTVWAGSNAWTKIGPEGANIASLALDPENPGTIYVSGFGGSFKSTDGGATWNVMDTGAYPVRLMIDPKNPTTIYATASATTGFVLKSTD